MGVRVGVAVVVLCAVGAPGRAAAFERFGVDVPCDPAPEPCVLCHLSRDGGAGCAERPCLNPFGTALLGSTPWADVAGLDSDGDGYTNGEELGDPDGLVTGGAAECHCATNPGDPASAPPVDGDGDGLACRMDCDDDDATVQACPCTSTAECDDGVECTFDVCNAGVCANEPTSRCGDGGTPTGGGAGCACRAAPRGAPGTAALVLALALLARRRRGSA